MTRLLQAEDAASTQRKVADALKYEARQMGKDCLKTENTLQLDSCLLSVEQKTQQNLDVFLNGLSELLGSSGAQQLAVAQVDWQKSSASTCDAVYTFYRQGTIRSSAAANCRIRLMRSRMQDLDAVYSTLLHL